MKTRFYSIKELKEMGRTKEFGLSEFSISNNMEGQLTIYSTKDVIDNQLTIYDMLPKKSKKRKAKKLVLK